MVLVGFTLIFLSFLGQNVYAGSQSFCTVDRVLKFPDSAYNYSYNDQAFIDFYIQNISILPHNLQEACQNGGGDQFNSIQLTNKSTSGKNIVIKVGEEKIFSIANVKVKLSAYKSTRDQICLMSLLPSTNWFNLGCINYQQGAFQESNNSKGKNCFVSQSCYEDAMMNSKTNFNVMSIIAVCIKNTIDKLLDTNPSCSTGDNHFLNLASLQKNMRNIVSSLLVLYVTLYGIKIVSGAAKPDAKEWFMFFAKFIAVLYFSVGIPDGNGNYSQGVSSYLQPLFMNLSSSINSILYEDAAEVTNLCQFDPEKDYISEFSYLAMWDSLDCRLSHYLFGSQVAQESFSAAIIFPIFTYFLPAIFSLQIPFFILLVFYLLFIISIFIFFCTIFFVAQILLSVLLFFAPVFVPFALFQKTKGYFDSWLKLIISYSMQPVVISVFVIMMFMVFDHFLYDNCKWDMAEINKMTDYGVTKIKQFNISASSGANCNKSFGGMIMNAIEGNMMISAVHLLFFKIPILNSSTASNLMSQMVKAIIFLVLFYNFVKSLSRFAADVTDGHDIGKAAVSPTALFDAAIAAAVTAAKAAANKAMGPKKEADAPPRTGNNSQSQVSRPNNTSGASVGTAGNNSSGATSQSQ